MSELAKGVGAEILYLPAYSPDFNEIEHQWFPIKIEQGKISLSLNLSVKLSILPFYEPFGLL